MKGRLKLVSWHAKEDGSLVVQAVVKTHAAKIARQTMGIAKNEGELLDLLKASNEAFPNPGKKRVDGGTA